MNADKDIAILILSCDKYADAWPPFFALFKKFWPDCPFHVYLGTNEENFNFPGVTVVHSGKPVNWSADTAAILRQIPEQNVLLLLEDYFLMHAIDETLLKNCISLFKKENAVFMRLCSFRADHFPMYAYDVLPEFPFAGRTRMDAPFRINLQAGLWNREGFLELLRDGESAWEFEVNGSARSRESKRAFLGIVDDPAKTYVHGPIPYLCTAITKGTWMREAIGVCEKENVPLDLSHRPVESRFSFNKRRIYHSLPYGARKYVDYVSGLLFGRK